MGTSNFAYNVNANCIYAIEDSYYDEETDEIMYDEFAWENTIDSVSDLIANSIQDSKELLWFKESDLNVDSRYDRNYPATSIGELVYDGGFEDIFYRIALIPKTIAGYYSGFSLDYDIIVEVEGTTYEDIEDVIEDMKNYPEDFDISEDELDKYIPDFEYELSSNLIFMSSIIENVFKQVSVPLGIAAIFSNGETIYTECKG